MAEEQINNLKICFAKMEQKMENIEQAVLEMKKSLDEMGDRIEKRYAGKWVEKVAIGVLVVVVSLVLKLLSEK